MARARPGRRGRRSGRDRGAQAIERATRLAGVRVAGLYDVGEERTALRGLERAGVSAEWFFACDPDLEGELVRRGRCGRMLALVEERGQLGAFRTYRKQPAQRAKPLERSCTAGCTTGRSAMRRRSSRCSTSPRAAAARRARGGQPLNQRARRLAPNRLFSATRSSDGSVNVPVGFGPEKVDVDAADAARPELDVARTAPVVRRRRLGSAPPRDERLGDDARLPLREHPRLGHAHGRDVPDGVHVRKRVARVRASTGM